MKRHKKLIIPVLVLVAVAIALSVTLTGRGAPSVNPPTASAAGVSTARDAGTNEAAGPRVIVSADFAVLYSSVAELKQAADVVVRGEVIDVSYIDFNSTAYTKVAFKVSKCFKGGLAVGDQITIVEVGGITNMAAIKGEKFGAPSKEDAETKVIVQLEGAPLTRVGDKCTYFLGTGSIGVVDGTYYVPLGAFQGRFKSENGISKRFVPDDWEGGKYSALSQADTSLDETVQAVQ